jgi:Circularly permutated YpsA SLOG family
MLDKVLSGGESGAEQAGWRVAVAFGIATGGWMPEGFPTVDGPRPEFAHQYGAVELPTDSVLAGYEQNIQASDGTLWFGETTTALAQTTVASCRRIGKPCMLIYPTASFAPTHVATWIKENKIKTLHVTGNHEEEESGIGDKVEGFLGQVLQQFGDKRN